MRYYTPTVEECKMYTAVSRRSVAEVGLSHATH